MSGKLTQEQLKALGLLEEDEQPQDSLNGTTDTLSSITKAELQGTKWDIQSQIQQTPSYLQEKKAAERARWAAQYSNAIYGTGPQGTGTGMRAFVNMVKKWIWNEDDKSLLADVAQTGEDLMRSAEDRSIDVITSAFTPWGKLDKEQQRQQQELLQNYYDKLGIGTQLPKDIDDGADGTLWEWYKNNFFISQFDNDTARAILSDNEYKDFLQFKNASAARIQGLKAIENKEEGAQSADVVRAHTYFDLDKQREIAYKLAQAAIGNPDDLKHKHKTLYNQSLERTFADKDKRDAWLAANFDTATQQQQEETLKSFKELVLNSNPYWQEFAGDKINDDNDSIKDQLAKFMLLSDLTGDQNAYNVIAQSLQDEAASNQSALEKLGKGLWGFGTVFAGSTIETIGATEGLFEAILMTIPNIVMAANQDEYSFWESLGQHYMDNLTNFMTEYGTNLFRTGVILPSQQKRYLELGLAANQILETAEQQDTMGDAWNTMMQLLQQSGFTASIMSEMGWGTKLASKAVAQIPKGIARASSAVAQTAMLRRSAGARAFAIKANSALQKKIQTAQNIGTHTAIASSTHGEGVLEAEITYDKFMDEGGQAILAERNGQIKEQLLQSKDLNTLLQFMNEIGMDTSGYQMPLQLNKHGVEENAEAQAARTKMEKTLKEKAINEIMNNDELMDNLYQRWAASGDEKGVALKNKIEQNYRDLEMAASNGALTDMMLNEFIVGVGRYAMARLWNIRPVQEAAQAVKQKTLNGVSNVAGGVVGKIGSKEAGQAIRRDIRNSMNPIRTNAAGHTTYEHAGISPLGIAGNAVYEGIEEMAQYAMSELGYRQAKNLYRDYYDHRFNSEIMNATADEFFSPINALGRLYAATEIGSGKFFEDIVSDQAWTEGKMGFFGSIIFPSILTGHEYMSASRSRYQRFKDWGWVKDGEENKWTASNVIAKGLSYGFGWAGVRSRLTDSMKMHYDEKGQRWMSVNDQINEVRQQFAEKLENMYQDPETRAAFLSAVGTQAWLAKYQQAAANDNESDMREGSMGMVIETVNNLLKTGGTEYLNTILASLQARAGIDVEGYSKSQNTGVDAMISEYKTANKIKDEDNVSDKEVLRQIKRQANKMLDVIGRVEDAGRAVDKQFGSRIDEDFRDAMIYRTVQIQDFKQRRDVIRKIFNAVKDNHNKSYTKRNGLSAQDNALIALYEKSKNVQDQLTNAQKGLQQIRENQKQLEEEPEKFMKEQDNALVSQMLQTGMSEEEKESFKKEHLNATRVTLRRRELEMMDKIDKLQSDYDKMVEIEKAHPSKKDRALNAADILDLDESTIASMLKNKDNYSNEQQKAIESVQKDINIIAKNYLTKSDDTSFNSAAELADQLNQDYDTFLRKRSNTDDMQSESWEMLADEFTTLENKIDNEEEITRQIQNDPIAYQLYANAIKMEALNQTERAAFENSNVNKADTYDDFKNAMDQIRDENQNKWSRYLSFLDGKKNKFITKYRKEYKDVEQYLDAGNVEKDQRESYATVLRAIQQHDDLIPTHRKVSKNLATRIQRREAKKKINDLLSNVLAKINSGIYDSELGLGTEENGSTKKATREKFYNWFKDTIQTIFNTQVKKAKQNAKVDKKRGTPVNYSNGSYHALKKEEQKKDEKKKADQKSQTGTKQSNGTYTEKNINEQKTSGKVLYDMSTFKQDVFDKIKDRHKQGVFVKVGNNVWLAVEAESSDTDTTKIGEREYLLLVQCDSNQNAYLYDLASKISENNAVLKEGSQEITTQSQITSTSANYNLKNLENNKSKVVKSDEVKDWTVRVDNNGPYVMIKDDNGTEHRLQLFVKKNSVLTDDEKKKVKEEFTELYNKLNSNGKSLSVENFIKYRFYSTDYSNWDFSDIDKALDYALSNATTFQLQDKDSNNIKLFVDLGLISVKQDVTPTVSSIQANFEGTTATVAPVSQSTDQNGNINPVKLTEDDKEKIKQAHCTPSSLSGWDRTGELSTKRNRFKPSTATIVGTQVDWLCRVIISKLLQNGSWKYSDVKDLIKDLIENEDDINKATIDGRNPRDVINNLFFKRTKGSITGNQAEQVKDFVEYVFKVIKNFKDSVIDQNATNIKFDTSDNPMMGYVRLIDNTGETYSVPMLGKPDCLITWEVNGIKYGAVIDFKTSKSNFSAKEITQRAYPQQVAVYAHLLSQRDGINLNNIRTFIMPVKVTYTGKATDKYSKDSDYTGNAFTNINLNDNVTNKIDKLEDESQGYTGGLIETTNMKQTNGSVVRVAGDAVQINLKFAQDVKDVSQKVEAGSQAVISEEEQKARDEQKAKELALDVSDEEDEIEAHKDDDSIDCSNLEDRDYTVNEMVTILKDKIRNIPQRYQAIFNTMVAAMKKAGITCRFDFAKKDTSARFTHSGHHGIISFGTNLTIHSFMHECVHAMINYYYNIPRAQRSDAINAAFDALQEIYNQLRLSYVVHPEQFGIPQSAIDEDGASNDGHVYGMESFTEFVAELVDPSFIDAIVTEQLKQKDATLSGRIAKIFSTILGRREGNQREDKGLKEDAVLNALETIVNSATKFSSSRGQTKLIDFMDRNGDKLKTIEIDEKADMTRTIKIKGHSAEEFESRIGALMLVKKKDGKPVLTRVLDYNEDGSISVCVVEDGYLEDSDTELDISENDIPYMTYNTQTAKTQDDMIRIRQYGRRYVWGMWDGVTVNGKELDVDRTLANFGSFMSKEDWYALNPKMKEHVLKCYGIVKQ